MEVWLSSISSTTGWNEIMARYPEISSFMNLITEEGQTLYTELRSWSGALINELDTRDTQMDEQASTKILAVVTVTDIGSPLTGSVAFSTGESKFKGFDGTNWQDFH